jgi:superfamily I DNA and/or RNA helicase
MVAAPSNTAIDHMASTLLRCGLNILRVGNPGKTDAAILAHTPEGKMQQSNQQKEIKQLKIRAEEFRKMALKYKRSFGKAEREQRQLLFKEVKSIRAAIKELRNYYEEKLYRDADVILGTPVGLYDAGLHKLTFGTLLIDEAGQCIEPLAWSIFPLADKIVLAGDHLQLPPTVISEEAAKLGLSKSILEQAIQHHPQQYLLNIQYRMRESIAGFSSAYFYKGLLRSAAHLKNNGLHIHFIDMAGSGENETAGADGISLQNEGEISIAQKLLETEALVIENTAFITPYSGQVAAARTKLPATLRISTIDSFQGQEKENIVLSLVRSNDEGIIGFLKDYRRMNVALTRAKEQLFIIGDSATIGADPFFNQLLEYVEAKGKYRSVWEFMV